MEIARALCAKAAWSDNSDYYLIGDSKMANSKSQMAIYNVVGRLGTYH